MIRDFIFLILFLLLLAGWGIAWIGFHIMAGGIHILLGLAVIFLILHLFSGRRAA